MARFRLVDAFTEAAFAGNPAGVVVLDHGPADDVWMQALAAEIGASETAFLHREADGWRLRWFTPTLETDLCGHATLASAHALWEDGAAPTDRDLEFSTRSGQLRATTADGRIVIDLPAWPVRDHPEPPSLVDALGGTTGRYLGRTAGTEAGGGSAADGSAGLAQHNDVVEVADEATLTALEPDLAAVWAMGSAGLIVTARADGDDDLVSRYFAPASGIDEDPVTGSAHSTLGPLWSQRLGRNHLTARQLSPRGGHLTIEVDGDRVRVGGHAVTVVRGEVAAPPAVDR